MNTSGRGIGPVNGFDTPCDTSCSIPCDTSYDLDWACFNRIRSGPMRGTTSQGLVACSSSMCRMQQLHVSHAYAAAPCVACSSSMCRISGHRPYASCSVMHGSFIFAHGSFAAPRGLFTVPHRCLCHMMSVPFTERQDVQVVRQRHSTSINSSAPMSVLRSDLDPDVHEQPCGLC